MNSATAHRFRGRAGRRIAAAVLAAAALGLGTTACGQDSGATGAAGSSGSSSASGSEHNSASRQATSGSSSDTSGSQGQDGGTPATGSSAGRGAGTGVSSKAGGNTGSGSASARSGVADAGNHRTIVGTLEYLAPGKLTVKPQGGGREQAFLISHATRILGAAAICSDTDGSVTIGKDGYGTSKCTVEQVETAAKTSSVTVRVTMNPTSGGGETVEEKYHP